MIKEFGRESAHCAAQVDGLAAAGMTASVALTIGRHESGLYTAQLSRTTVQPQRLQVMGLPWADDVPPGNRRATWLLTDFVTAALSDPEAHLLLHW